ncbi:MAG TPA: FAD-dependent oxidoreductase [Acetobacteraceae bacterium]|nr:FAD-dependent oxidoreductase [Acetobacteraceae bacterium]
MTGAVPDVVVIGGGLHGCSAALHLAKRGARVTVLEKDYVGRHASGVNAGGVRRLGRHFAEVPLSVASLELWYRIRDLVDDDCGFEHHGQVRVAENEAEFATLHERAAELNRLGFDHEEVIDQAELRRLVPAIAQHCIGGLVSRADGAANPYRTTMAFKRKAESCGVRFVEGARVTTLRRSGRHWSVEAQDGTRWEAPVLVNCAGAWADRIAAQLGEPVPLEVWALMLMISAPMPRFLEPVIGAAGRPLSFKQYANGTVLVGGGYKGRPQRDENWTDLDFRGLAQSARTVWDLFPIMRSAQIVRSWAGIEGRLPDDIPVIGPSSTEEGVFHAFGFAGHGFQLGPVVGSITAELVSTGSSNLPIAPFRIDRFRAPALFQPSGV